MVAKKPKPKSLPTPSIVDALAAAQADLDRGGPVVKDRKTDDGWWHATSEAIDEAARPVLKRNGLTLFYLGHVIRHEGGGWVLSAKYQLRHGPSRQALEVTSELPFLARASAGIQLENVAKSVLIATERYALRMLLRIQVVNPSEATQTTMWAPTPTPAPAPSAAAPEPDPTPPVDFDALWARLVSEQPTIAKAVGSADRARDMVSGTDDDLRRWYAAALGEVA